MSTSNPYQEHFADSDRELDLIDGREADQLRSAWEKRWETPHDQYSAVELRNIPWSHIDEEDPYLPIEESFGDAA